MVKNMAMRRSWLLGIMLGALLLLGACSPQYDWRQVSVGKGQVRAMLPAKPLASDREFQFEGQAITFSLSSASVNQVLFAVGYAELPQDLKQDAGARQRLIEQTLASFYHNLGQVLPDTKPELARRIPIQGTGQADQLRMEVMIWATPDALIEGMVVGPAEQLDADQLDEFFRELAPDQRPAS